MQPIVQADGGKVARGIPIIRDGEIADGRSDKLRDGGLLASHLARGAAHLGRKVEGVDFRLMEAYARTDPCEKKREK